MRLRSRRLPDDASAAAGVQPGEYVIAWAPVDGGETVIASDRGLRLPGPAELIPWQRVVLAAWDGAVLQVRTVDDRGRPEPVVRLSIDEGSDLAAAVRDRVMDNVVITERVPITSDLGALLVARRQPGTDSIAWSVVFDAGLDHDDPALRAIADARLSDLRASLGI